MSREPSLVLLAIDPSIRNLGYAWCQLPEGERNIYDLTFWQSGVIHPAGLEIHHKWADGFDQLAALFRARGIWPTDIVVEWPAYFGSQKGRIAAQLDHTIGLAAMAAGIIAWFRLPTAHITLLTPMQWKGSVPKEVTRARLEKAFNADSEGLSNDEVDAIGIAEYWLKTCWLSRNGPSLNERHAGQEADLIRLCTDARAKSAGNDAAWWARISTVLRQRQDIGCGLARTVLRREFKIRPKQIQTIMSNA